jgi:predicted MPP superfamily phosphohydrolase
VNRSRATKVSGTFVAGVVAYAGLVEPRRLVVRRLRLELPRWPAALAGLRVGVLTDLHAGMLHGSERTVARWVERMNAEAPDLVLLGGDFTDAHPLRGGRLAPERIAERVAALEAPLGRVAVLGNHDWRQYGMRMWTALTAAGVPVLENDARAFEATGGRFHVAGLADIRHRRPDVARTLAAVPGGEPVIVLAHDPDVFPRIPSRVALTVSGHTHGGQIAIPIVRRIVIPSRYGERYARGHIVEHGRHLVVGTGLGTSGLPLRLFAPPELLVLELHPEPR